MTCLIPVCALTAALCEERALSARLRGEVSDSSQLQAEVRAALAKLVHSQEAMENSFTCLHCLQLFASPSTCVPCGHTSCAACVLRLPDHPDHDDRPVCQECGPASAVEVQL